MKANFIFLILFLASTNMAKSQDCDSVSDIEWEFITWEPAPDPQTDFYIECHVSNFKDVSSFQFTLNFDNSNIQYLFIDNVGNPLDGDVFVSDSASVLDNGYLPTGWININGEGQTIDDGTIFRVWFKIIGDPKSCYDWTIDSAIAEMEVTYKLANGNLCSKDNIHYQIAEPCMCSSLFLLNSTCPNFLELSACGGEGPYSYILNGPTGEIIGMLTEDQIESFDNLQEGTYSVTVQDDAFNQYHTEIEVPGANEVIFTEATICNSDDLGNSTLLDLSTIIQSSLPFYITGPGGDVLENNVVDFNGLAAGLYEYTFVVGNDLCGFENYSSFVEVQNCTTSSNENIQQTIPEIFPNPNSGIFMIDAEESMSAIIYDTNGKSVFEMNLAPGRNNVKLNQEAIGLYFVKFFEEGALVGIQKLVIQ